MHRNFIPILTIYKNGTNLINQILQHINNKSMLNLDLFFAIIKFKDGVKF